MRKTSTNQTRRWPSAISSFLLLHASFANPVDDTGNNNFQRLFMDCDVDTYYESVRDLDNGGWINTETSSSSFQQEGIRTLLSLLLHKTHRQMLSTDSFDSRSFVPDPSTADMNTAQALQFLDAGTERPNTVQMIFTQTEMEADALGMGGGWEPGYLWDIRGVVAAEEENETTAFAESDLHNLRPRHVNLNNDAALQGLFYGNCYQCYQEDKAGSDDSNILFHDGTRALAAAGRDRIGSTNGGSTSSTTSNNMRSTQNSRSSNSNNSNNDPLCLCPNEQALQPPVEARGEIARALLYMELRYGIPTTASDGLGLSLSDCPPQNNSTNSGNSYNMQRIGYFSRLVQWHLEYPPTEREIQRNDAICQYYQGNRNPFVDFPEDSWSLLPFATVDGEECPTSNDETVEEDKSLVDESTEQGVTTPEQDVVVVDEDAPTESETKEDSSTTTTTDGRLEDSTHPCDDFMAGDINFNMIDQSTSAFGLVALIDVPENMELFVTSNPWDAATSTFDASEGSTIKVS
jgi:endonuclease I